MAKSLKILRVVVSLACFVVLTVVATLPGLLVPQVGQWLEHLQIGPAVMAMTLSVFMGWLAVTLAFGRIYCSSLCPMGTLMDISARTRRTLQGKRCKPYRYTPASNAIRYGMLIVAVLAMMGLMPALASVLDPAGAFSRVCTDMFRPLLSYAFTLLEPLGVTAPAAVASITTGVTASIIATFIFMITVAVSARSGRTLCNTLCPVGTTLGFVSRYAIYQIDIDTDKCIQCRRCVDVCKSRCIDLTDHVVDGSRCVVCFNCIGVCPNDAIHYTTNRHRLATPLMQPTKLTGQSSSSITETPPTQ